MTHDLNILNEQGVPDGPWMLQTPAATTLVLVGAADELMGIPEGLAAAIADCVGEAVDLDKPEATPSDVPWIATVHVPALPSPLLCWPEAEAAGDMGLPEGVEQRHGLVVQTLLHPGDPLTCLLNVARLLCLLDPAAPGLLDTDTGRWLDRDLLEREFLSDVLEPPEDMLWIVHGIQQDERMSVLTEGLSRCGRHELRIDDVPEDQLDAAADLVASVAALCLETPLPASGVQAEVGPDMHVLVESCPSGARLCSTSGGPPLDILQRLQSGQNSVYRTDRSAKRQRAYALATWEDFLDIAQQGEHACFVEVPFEDPTGKELRREHLWMEVTGVQDDVIMARPAHQAMLAQGLDTDEQAIHLDEVASWRVLMDDQAWGPELLGPLQARLMS